MLRLVEKALSDRGITSVVYTGDLTRAKRDRAIREFQQTDGGPQVFLASYGAGSTGLTLTAANVVYLLDPWWNPFTEDQAIDRVHRIGQTRPVRIYKVTMAESIEQGVVACQTSKRKASEGILGSSAGRPTASVGVSVGELSALLSSRR
ncbi:putative SNF2 helicase [Gregarina niphandrodes]|uniref:SNF2 helicase n=1 Tax=Gregarina niphandrodes TaxID=110365 RepID=A0A023B3L0_GRENI|nr:putative SNF2 helicase [Gregarina niphandrodes]EZG55605.1 putative SNF2 helicase [Gregarina niphandrodes]|eukprot:XP_011131482.1 putative SNF2 helicase [Gregarina niphandrodes]